MVLQQPWASRSSRSALLVASAAETIQMSRLASSPCVRKTPGNFIHKRARRTSFTSPRHCTMPDRHRRHFNRPRRLVPARVPVQVGGLGPLASPSPDHRAQARRSCRNSNRHARRPVSFPLSRLYHPPSRFCPSRSPRSTCIPLPLLSLRSKKVLHRRQTPRF